MDKKIIALVLVLFVFILPIAPAWAQEVNSAPATSDASAPTPVAPISAPSDSSDKPTKVQKDTPISAPKDNPDLAPDNTTPDVTAPAVDQKQNDNKPTDNPDAQP